MAFDKRPVEKALRQVSPGPAREYLEKIVQVSFSLPPIADTTPTEIILNTFNETLGIEGVDIQRFGNMFHSGFRASFRTIRDVNRYFNLFRFALNLMSRDTNFIDLAAIEAVALFYPSLYQAIEANAELFAGGWGSSDERRDKQSVRIEYDKIFSSLRGPRRDSAVSLCTFLFPKLEWVNGPSNVIYGPQSEQSWQKKKRIAASKYFPYYFHLAVPETDVSQSELDRAIEETASVTAFVEVLRRFRASQRFSAFIDRLRDQLSSLGQEQLLVILQSIFVFGDEVETEGSLLLGLISEYIRFGTWLLFDILDVLGPNRFNLLCDGMRGRPAVFTISDTTIMFDKVISGASDSARLRSRYPDLSSEIVTEMKAISVDTIEQAARENRLQTAPRLGAVLYRWREWGDAKRVSDWVSSTFLHSPEGAVSLVMAFARTITSMSAGDKVARFRITVSIKEMGELADLDLIAKLLQDARDDKLTDKQREAKARFLSAKAKLDSGENPDDRFPFDDAAAYNMAGRFTDAKRAADELAEHIGPMVLGDISMAEPSVPTPIFVLLRFHRWDEVLKLPLPDSNLAMTTAFWHFARGSAAAAKGQLGIAEMERKTLEETRKKMPADTEFSMYSNKAQAFLDLAANILDARIATAHADRERAIEYWKNAVQIQDRLCYGEPPEWFYPVRESLGGALLLNGQADQAEAVFRADLEQYPRNPRSLFGLLKSLEAQNKISDAEWVRREFEAAWKSADVTLKLGDL